MSDELTTSSGGAGLRRRYARGDVALLAVCFTVPMAMLLGSIVLVIVRWHAINSGRLGTLYIAISLFVGSWILNFVARVRLTPRFTRRAEALNRTAP